MPTKRQIKQRKNPYVLALGNLVIAWNALQENLAELFWAITDLPDGTIPLSIWHSTNNDRTQREMLRAMTEAIFTQRAARELDATVKGNTLRIRDDIIWLINKANSLADQRNDAVHSPLWFVIDATGSGKIGEMIPADYFGNPRAKKLKGKDLLNEFRWYRQSADTLASYALRIRFVLSPGLTPWPDRPQMPRLVQSRTRKPKRHRKNAK